MLVGLALRPKDPGGIRHEVSGGIMNTGEVLRPEREVLLVRKNALSNTANLPRRSLFPLGEGARSS